MNKHSTVRALRPSPMADAWAINRRVFASGLHPAAKIVLLVVLDHARHGKSQCTASNATIARESAIGVRQVISHIKYLVGHQWLELERLGPTVNHGRILRMGGVCCGLHTTLRRAADPPLHGLADPLCTTVQTNGSGRGEEKGAGKRPAAVETAGHLPAMERFFPQFIPETTKGATT